MPAWSIRYPVMVLLLLVSDVAHPEAESLTAKIVIGKTLLPDQVPYLNRPEDFFIGNGMAGGGGAGDGRWNFLVGPDYTCPNYLRNEEIWLVIDGEPRLAAMEVHRARNTGIFYGLTTIGDLEICVIDHASRGEPWTARLVRIKNKSTTGTHKVSVQAQVTPLIGQGRCASLVVDSSGRASGVSLKLDTSLKCVVNWVCQNWANRYALITFNDPAATATNCGGTYILDSGVKSIAAGDSYSVALYHYMHFDDKTERDCIRLVRERNSASDAENCIHQWQSWFDGVDATFSLDRIKDQRARDIVEGGLATLKMNQSRDGGMVANERGWDMSYVRDAYCGLRGLSENGHFEELKSFIQWLDHKYSVHGFVPNAAPGGSDTYAHPNGNSGGPCPEANTAVEVTALYLLAARDYYKGTHDLQTLTKADQSLRYAMDIQLKQAVANGYRLEFGGDETELCGAVDVGPAGFDRKLSRYWSMTSLALCSASLDFYIQYLKAKGINPADYWNRQDHHVLNLNVELGRLTDALESDYWRMDVPECPGGFHDWFRVKSNRRWPQARVVNFTLFPLYYETPLKYPERGIKDVYAVSQYFNETTRLLPLTAVAGGKSLGHDLGYLLWDLVAIGDSKKNAVYDALVNGPTVGCWGTYNEAYDDGAAPNANGLRSFETGVNIGAIARFWGLGDRPAQKLIPASPLMLPPGTWVPIDDNHSAITYSGSWNFSTTSQGYYQTNCHYSNQAGSSAQFTFDGTGIRWIGGKNNDHGEAGVYIDGALQAELNTHATSWLTRQVLYEKAGLANGHHTIRIVVNGGGNQDVDAFWYCTGEQIK